jgi:hypothetical protein
LAALPTFDGGLVDTVPIAPPVEARGGRTLALLTRRYRRLPGVQPSAPMRIKQFDITNPGGIRAA